MMSFRTSHNDDSISRSDPGSPDASSGAHTPIETSPSSPAFLPPSMSSIWGGLIRRFSSQTDVPSQSTATSAGLSGSLHHSQTSPYPGPPSNDGVDGVFTPAHTQRTASPMRPPPLEPLSLDGFRDDTTHDARLLTPAIAEEIRIMVPARLTIVDEWSLVYSLDQDGASLATLYEKCRRYEGKRVGFVLVVRDREGGIFGGYLSESPHPAPKYFGTGECFLWRASVMASLPPPPSADTTNLTGRSTTIVASPTFPTQQGGLLSPSSDSFSSHGIGPVPPSPSIRFKAFPYSGVNEYYLLCESHFLSMGAGDGKYGLWVDDGLAKGVSSTCLTFGNEQLSDEGEKFGVLGVELWVIGAPGL